MDEYEQLLDNIYKNLPEKAREKSERWEAPKFDFFVEGNKTVIRNFMDVVEKVRRDKEFLVKYLSKELAVPVVLEGERLVLHRKITGDIVNVKLRDFIEKYVMCKECKKPDTHLEQLGHGMRQLVCEACGAKAAVS
ncbi:MAG TPA: translation initiation factor IF-2 subunit beta [Candidatus Bilamarchaeaceae archaeon]|nr:translation initiation factor IF-2 subunit beta [Candidatus Bilamarchaeaceae archaeon]